jgi:hypothetical protein
VGIPPDNILFLPINAAVCEDWFSFPTFRSLYNTRRSSLNDRALGYSLCEDFQEVLFSEFGCVTLADCVDDALCNPTAGLDRLLEQQVKRLQDAFEAARKAARDLRNQNWEVVKKRWETDENS